MAQEMIHEHDREHGFGDWRRAQAHARIVAAGRDDLDRLSGEIDGLPRHLNAGRGFQRYVNDDVLPGGNAAEHAARVVAPETRGRELVPMLAALLLDRARARADLYRLHGV